MILEGRHIYKTYEKEDGAVLKDVSISADEGDFICVMGPSGCGKSTLLNILAGLLENDEGEVLIQGDSYKSLSEEEISHKRKSEIGYVAQGYSLLKNYTLGDNLLLPLLLREDVDDVLDEVQKALDLVGLLEKKNRYPSKLSGGEQRRGALARAFVIHPKIIIADEPTADLDADNAGAILELLFKESKKGTAVIISTHDEKAKKYATKILEL